MAFLFAQDGGFVVRYSGATAQDFHLFPYSPEVVTKGTGKGKRIKEQGLTWRR